MSCRNRTWFFIATHGWIGFGPRAPPSETRCDAVCPTGAGSLGRVELRALAVMAAIEVAVFGPMYVCELARISSGFGTFVASSPSSSRPVSVMTVEDGESRQDVRDACSRPPDDAEAPSSPVESRGFWLACHINSLLILLNSHAAVHPLVVKATLRVGQHRPEARTAPGYGRVGVGARREDRVPRVHLDFAAHDPQPPCASPW